MDFQQISGVEAPPGRAAPRRRPPAGHGLGADSAALTVRATAKALAAGEAMVRALAPGRDRSLAVVDLEAGRELLAAAEEECTRALQAGEGAFSPPAPKRGECGED